MASGDSHRSDRFCRVTVAGLLAVALLGTPVAAHGAGPWRGTVVDAETGLPLEGVVVLAEFIKYTSGLAGASSPGFHGANEVVSGPDGRFEIPARALWNPMRWFSRVEVEFVIFKPGYGRAEARGVSRTAAGQDRTWGQLLEEEGAFIELPPLTTREQRLAFYRSHRFPRPAPLVPAEHQSRYREAVARERAYLGFRDRGGDPR